MAETSVDVDMAESLGVESDIEPTSECEETESGYSGGGSSSSTVTPASLQSLLDVLRCPPASHLARRRKLNTLPPSGRKRSRGSITATCPKSVTPRDRVKEYPGERLLVSNNKLFCQACREELSLKKSSVEKHCKSQKHKKGKEVRIRREEGTRHIPMSPRLRPSSTSIG